MRTLNTQTYHANLTTVASSTSAVAFLATDETRQGLTIFNDSTAILSVCLGTAAELTGGKVTAKLAAGQLWEVPFGYVGPVAGLWATANGNALVSTFK